MRAREEAEVRAREEAEVRAREEAEVRAREEASICRTRSLTSELSSCGRLGEVSRKCPREAPPLPPPPKTRRLREGRTRWCGHRYRCQTCRLSRR